MLCLECRCSVWPVLGTTSFAKPPVVGIHHSKRQLNRIKLELRSAATSSICRWIRGLVPRKANVSELLPVAQLRHSPLLLVKHRCGSSYRMISWCWTRSMQSILQALQRFVWLPRGFCWPSIFVIRNTFVSDIAECFPHANHWLHRCNPNCYP